MRPKIKKVGRIKAAILGWLGVPIGLTDAAFWSNFSTREAGQDVSESSILKLSAAWSCVRLISETIATLPICLYERGASGRRPAKEHPVYEIIHSRPNADTTAAVFWEAIIASMLLRGNGFAERKFLDSTQVGLDFLYPGRMNIVRDISGNRQYRYTDRNGKQRVIPNSRIFRIPGFTLDGDWGLSAIEYGAAVFGSGLAAATAANRTFENGLMPTVAFKLDHVIKKEQREDFRASVTAISGALNAGKSPCLEAGMDAISIGINPKDAQLLESRAFSVEEICFVPGTKILTLCGFKPIEDIEVGEYVLTHKGKWRAVKKTMVREYNGDVVTVKAKGLNAVTSTTNHPFYAQKIVVNKTHKQEPIGLPEWIDASNLKIGSRNSANKRDRGEFHALTIPKIVEDISILKLDMAEWSPLDAVKSESVIKYSSNHRSTNVKRYIPLNYELGWLCGIYASDGSVSDHQVVFYLGSHEVEATARLGKYIQSVFGLECTTTINRSVARTVISNRILAEFFSDFGKSADTKALPRFSLASNPDFRKGVIDGLIDGDGCLYKNRTQLRTTSEKLAWQTRLLLWADGANGSMQTTKAGMWNIEGRSGESLPIYTVEWRQSKQRRGSMGQNEEVAYFNIDRHETKKYDGLVYNLEVEVDESYTTEGGCVHNCRWFRVPPYMVGHSEKSTSWGTGIEQQMIGFLTFTLRPWLTRIEQAINKDLLSPVEQKRFYAEFNFEGLLRADSQSRAEYYAKMAANGMMTRDEVRDKENFAAKGGNADVLTVQSAMVPLDMVGQFKSGPEPAKETGDEITK